MAVTYAEETPGQIYAYTEEQEAIRKMVRDFAEKELAPGANERDRTGKHDYKLYRRMGELGLLGLRCPEEYGGGGAGVLTDCLVQEELGRVDMSLALSRVGGSRIARTILEEGTPEQIELWKDKWVIPVMKGEVVGSGSQTEPGGGSDQRAFKTTAVLDGDEWVINGAKAFADNVNSDIFAVISVMCITDKEKGLADYILVPAGTPGISIRSVKFMGLRSFNIGEISFDNCRVPAINLIGSRGTSRERFAIDIGGDRIGGASMALGIHGASFEKSLSYAQGRIAFGRPIAEFQYIQAMLVEMAINLELSRLLRDKVARFVDQGIPQVKESSMAKIFCCESAIKAADCAIQIHGAFGLTDDSSVSRYYRDVRATTIAEGTTEIQKYIIAREFGIRHSLRRS